MERRAQFSFWHSCLHRALCSRPGFSGCKWVLGIVVEPLPLSGKRKDLYF